MAYRSAPPSVRRAFNQAFFEQLFIEDDEHVHSVLAEPFKTLLSPEIQQLAAAPTREPEPANALTNGNASGEEISGGVRRTCWNLKVPSVKQLKLVAGAGFEPATSGL
jgi:site-specific DNA recombinase